MHAARTFAEINVGVARKHAQLPAIAQRLCRHVVELVEVGLLCGSQRERDDTRYREWLCSDQRARRAVGSTEAPCEWGLPEVPGSWLRYPGRYRLV